MSPKHQDSFSLGIAFGLSGALLFSIMALLVRLSPSSISTGSLLAIRALFAILILTPICYRELNHLVRRTGRVIWLRALFGAAAVTCYYTNLRLTNLSTATLLADLSPLFVIPLSALFLRKSFHWRSLFGALLSIVGVSLLSAPQVIDLSWPVLVIGLIGAVMGASAFLSLKSAVKIFSPLTLIWALSFVLLLTGVPALLQSGGSFELQELLLLLAIAALSVIAQIVMTLSFRHLSTALASTLGLTACFWTMTLDLFVLNVQLPVLAVLAFFLTLAGIYITQTGTANQTSPDIGNT